MLWCHAGQAARKQNPPERGVSHAGGIPAAHGREDVKLFANDLTALSPKLGPGTRQQNQGGIDGPNEPPRQDLLFADSRYRR